ncbi:hypothetical protein ACI2IP_13255 [Microbacterium sp. NPDC090218]
MRPGRLQSVAASVVQDTTTQTTEVEANDVEEIVLPATAERSAHRLPMATSITSCDEVSDESVDVLIPVRPGRA